MPGPRLHPCGYPALLALWALLSGCFQEGSDDTAPRNTAKLGALTLTVVQATVRADVSGIRRTILPVDSLRDYGFYARLLASSNWLGTVPSFFSLPITSRGTLSLPLDTLGVSDSLNYLGLPPGFRVEPSSAHIIWLDVAEKKWLEAPPKPSKYSGLFDRKAGKAFTVVFADRAATLVRDTVVCGTRFTSSLHLPERGFHAYADSGDPRRPVMEPITLSDDLALYNVVRDFVQEQRLATLDTTCRDPDADRAELVGAWKSISPKSSGWQRMELRADDSCFQLWEDLSGARRRWNGRFVSDGTHIHLFNYSGMYEIQLSAGKDTLHLKQEYVLPEDRLIFVREAAAKAPDWIRPLEIRKVFQGDFSSARALAWGAGSFWVTKADPNGSGFVVQYDTTSERFLDSLRSDTGIYFNPKRMGLALEGDSIVWAPEEAVGIRFDLRTRVHLPYYNPAPQGRGIFTGQTVAGFEAGKLWTVNTVGTLIAWLPEGSIADTMPRIPQDPSNIPTVSGGRLLYPDDLQVHVRDVKSERFHLTFALEGREGRIWSLAVVGNSLAVLMDLIEGGQSRRVLALLGRPGPGPGQWGPLFPVP